MNTHISIQKKNLIRQFYAVCKGNGLKTEAIDAIKQGFGVEHTMDLTEYQLEETIKKLQGTADNWRKRVMAAIGHWLAGINKPQNPAMIKAIACRAASCENFNKIPVSKLQTIYYGFCKKGIVNAEIELIKSEEIETLTTLN